MYADSFRLFNSSILRQASNLEYLDRERRVTLTILESHCVNVWGRFCISLVVELFSSKGHESSLAMRCTVIGQEAQQEGIQ